MATDTPKTSKVRRNARRFALDRRTLLKGMLGGAVVSVGLPPLDKETDRFMLCGSCSTIR